MVPSREDRRNREELPMMGERWLRPRLHDDLVGFLVVGAVPPPPRICRNGPTKNSTPPGLIAAPDPDFGAPAADDIEHRGLLRDSNRMPPGDDVGGLPETNLARARCDRGFGKD